MTRLRAASVTLVVASLLTGPSLPSEAQVDEVGLPLGAAPEAVIIEDLDGNPVDLGQWVGRTPLVLEFWARWCEQCEALEPRMRSAVERYGDRVQFLAVGVGVNQNPRSIRRHLSGHPMAFPVLWDGTGAATRAFKAPTTSYVVMLDVAGKVAYTGVGPDQDIEGAVRRVLASPATEGR